MPHDPSAKRSKRCCKPNPSGRSSPRTASSRATWRDCMLSMIRVREKLGRSRRKERHAGTGEFDYHGTANVAAQRPPLLPSRHLDDLHWRFQGLPVRRSCLDLLDDVHALDDSAEGGESLAVGVAFAAEVEFRLVDRKRTRLNSSHIPYL